MRWEDARTLVTAIDATGYKPDENETYFMNKARKHITERRDMNKSDELPIHAIYRMAHFGRGK